MENQPVAGEKPLYSPGDFGLVAKQLQEQFGIKQEQIEHHKDGSIAASYVDKHGHEKSVHLTAKAIHKRAEEIRIAQAHSAHHSHIEVKHVIAPEIIEMVLDKYRRENSGCNVKGYQNKKGGVNVHVYRPNGQKIMHLSHNDVTRVVEDSIKNKPLPIQNKIKHLLNL